MSKRLLALAFIGATMLVLSGRFVHSQGKAPANVGKKIADFTLSDPRDDSRVSLDGLKDKKATVVVFVGTECPINNAYLPTLAALHREFVERGVQILGINSNAQDTSRRVAEHAKKHGVPFPVLKDDGNRVADLFEAKRTPEAILLDADGVIRYRGRIDDQFGIGFKRPKPTKRDLAEAITAVLDGKSVAQPTTAVAGCVIARAVKPAADGAVTFTKDVARILQNNCQECHRAGQIGPMPLLTYEDATAWSATIREVVAEERMPPWLADPKHGKFANDRRLSPKDKETLLAWISQDCPKGDDKDMPPPRTFAPGWLLGKPDAVVTMAEEFDVPAVTPKGGVPYKYFTVATDFKEDKWVQMAEAKAGAAEVVHHIIVFIVPPGKKFDPDSPGNSVLCGVAPGDTALRLPIGVAKKVPAGSRFVFQMHYTPDGTARKDRSSVGLFFAKEPPQREAETIAVLNPNFSIKPGEDNLRVDAWFKFKGDVEVLGFMPHMHLRGKDFLYEAIQPDGTKETLLSVPRYNFNWQNSYRLAKPVAMPTGSRLHCVAHFDNSAKNPNNPDPTQEVRWGDQTWEEMMIGWMEITRERKKN